MLEVNKGEKRELVKNVREHVGGGAPCDRDGVLLDEVVNPMLIYVNVFELRGGRVVYCEGDATLVVFIGDSRAVDGASEGREKLAHKYSVLRGGGEGHVLGFRGVESDIVLKLASPRDGAAKNNRYVSSAGSAIDAIGKGGILRDEEVGGDCAGESKAVVLGARDIAKNTLRLLPVMGIHQTF